MCRHRWLSVYAAAGEKYGIENVEVWQMKNNDTREFKYHMQVKVKINNEWFWADCQPRKVFLNKDYNHGCKPFKMIKGLK